MAHGTAYVATPTLVYCLMTDRAEFDRIAVPATQHGPAPGAPEFVITKSISGAEDVTVIFQFSQDVTRAEAAR
jgi:hypothetical protein